MLASRRAYVAAVDSQAAVERFMPEEAEAQRAVEECEALKAACDQALQAGAGGLP